MRIKKPNKWYSFLPIKPDSCSPNVQVNQRRKFSVKEKKTKNREARKELTSSACKVQHRSFILSIFSLHGMTWKVNTRSYECAITLKHITQIREQSISYKQWNHTWSTSQARKPQFLGKIWKEKKEAKTLIHLTYKNK